MDSLNLAIPIGMKHLRRHYFSIRKSDSTSTSTDSDSSNDVASTSTVSDHALKRFKAVVWAIVATKWFSPCRQVFVDAETVALIDLDLSRTLRDDPLVRPRVGWMRSLLLRHVATDPKLGYCQGMSLVAAVFAVASSSQKEAYFRYRNFILRLRNLWLPGFPLLKVAMSRFEEMAKTQPWYRHLLQHGVETSMYLPQALLTLFSAWLPVSTVLHCLSHLEKTDMIGLVAMAVTVMDSIADRLLKHGSMDALLFELQGLKMRAPDAQKLLTGLNYRLYQARSSQFHSVVRTKGCGPEFHMIPKPWSEYWADRTAQEWALWLLFS